MKKIRLADHLTDEELIQRTELSENKDQFRRWQAVCLIQTQGLSSAQIGKIVRVKPDTVLQRIYTITLLVFVGMIFALQAFSDHEQIGDIDYASEAIFVPTKTKFGVLYLYNNSGAEILRLGERGRRSRKRTCYHSRNSKASGGREAGAWGVGRLCL